jgi:PEP-CTERM motif
MKRFLLVVMCFICGVALVGPAHAITVGLDDLIGTVVPGSPASPTDELARLNQLIALYNANPGGITTTIDPPGPNGPYDYVVDAGANVPAPNLPDATGGVQVSPNDIPSFNSTYLYLLAKFGDQDAFYYLDGQTGTIELPIASPFPVQGGGLSHITLFNSSPPQVPEAATLMLLGIGLLGCGTFRRFMKR